MKIYMHLTTYERGVLILMQGQGLSLR